MLYVAFLILAVVLFVGFYLHMKREKAIMKAKHAVQEQELKEKESELKVPAKYLHPGSIMEQQIRSSIKEAYLRHCSGDRFALSDLKFWQTESVVYGREDIFNEELLRYEQTNLGAST